MVMGHNCFFLCMPDNFCLDTRYPSLGAGFVSSIPLNSAGLLWHAVTSLGISCIILKLSDFVGLCPEQPLV